MVILLSGCQKANCQSNYLIQTNYQTFTAENYIAESYSLDKQNNIVQFYGYNVGALVPQCSNTTLYLNREHQNKITEIKIK